MVNPGILNLAIIRGITFDARVLQLADESVTVSGTLSPGVTGTFVPCGTNAPPSGAGLTAQSDLEDDGWTVNVN